MSIPKSIKVTVESVMEDGKRSKIVFDMDPFRFDMTQDRDVRPVYDSFDFKNFGKPVRMEVNPQGNHLLIEGFTKAKEKK